MLHSWFLDPSISRLSPKLGNQRANAEPLLVNYVDTWRLRPEAVLAIPNLFLASDYVRTHTDIATMEAANEAARRAVNGILTATGSSAEPCAIWKLHEPELFAPLRGQDQMRYEAGLPWQAPLGGAEDVALSLVEVLAPSVETPVGAAPMSADDFLGQLERYRSMVLPKLFGAVGEREPREHLYDLVREQLARAGKGMRPALLLATTAAFGGDPSRALPTAAALEMLHNAFLIHDDIEDGSEYRRGQPTLYVSRGVPLAVNTGDAMQALSIRMLRENTAALSPGVSQKLIDEFDHMLIESLEGQAMELGWVLSNACNVGEDDYLAMVLKKTCWYSFTHPCRMGALIARGSDYPLSRFDRFGALLGAAFQIQDDVLNLVGDQDKYGKEIGGDLWEGKRTLILAHLLHHVGTTDREGLESILAKPRADRLPVEIERISRLIEQHQSLEYARRVAVELGTAASREFEAAFAEAPESPDKDFIRSLTRYALERDK